jgi:hypothetical protein
MARPGLRSGGQDQNEFAVTPRPPTTVFGQSPNDCSSKRTFGEEPTSAHISAATLSFDNTSLRDRRTIAGL